MKKLIVVLALSIAALSLIAVAGADPGGHGKLVALLRGTVSGGTFNRNATCAGTDCGSTATFLATFFGASAQFSCNTNSTDCKFNFNYTASHHQSLLIRHWQAKGTGAGTSLVERFKGDIADA